MNVAHLVPAKKFISAFAVVVLASVAMSQTGVAQVSNDPTAESEIIKQTMSKIRDVEKLDKYLEENRALKKANADLKKEIASIKKQLQKLTADLGQQAANIKKQLLQVPKFEIKAKLIGGGNDMAILKTGDRSIKVRLDTKMSVPVSDGVWVLMQVKKISKDMIELYFPELDRTVFLYD